MYFDLYGQSRRAVGWVDSGGMRGALQGFYVLTKISIIFLKIS